MSSHFEVERGAEAGEPLVAGERRDVTQKTERLGANEQGLARAAELLRGGGTVAFPTETVYGLGANALDSAAVEKIFWAKQRPGWDPLIVHVDGLAMVEQVATLPGGARGEVVSALMRAFWPGPLTLLLPRAVAVPDAVTSGRSLVGVRMPAHPLARDLIRRAGVPIAAPSANCFGHTSPTTAAHVLADLDGRIDAVLDGGATSVGVESTVLDLDAMAIYRPGAVTAAMISRVAGIEAWYARPEPMGEEAKPAEALPSPGMGMRHYAPRARLVLVEGQRGLLMEVARHAGAKLGVMLPDEWESGDAECVFRWGPWGGGGELLARLLFAGLRNLDERGVEVIVCPLPKAGGLGEAIRDRLGKAARVK